MLKKQTFIQTMTMALFVSFSYGFAQTTNSTNSTDPPRVDSSWVGVVTTDDATIRCGANESYYTVAVANKGDLVRVLGKSQDWFKIDTSGSVFGNTVGYIKYPSGGELSLVVSDDSGTANGGLEILAKNIDSDELYRSWRPILRLQENDVVSVIKSTVTEPGTLHRDSYVVHTVQMPETATCWISASNISRATPEQLDSLKEGEVVKKMGGDAEVIATGVEDMSGTPVAETETVVPLTLAELEAIWSKISSDPVMSAEVMPLRDMYEEVLSNNSGDIVVEQIACGRIKQLEVWSGLQDQRMRIDLLLTKLAKQSGDVLELQTVLSMSNGYVVAGRLALSNTFDGRIRPFMYRIQDLKSGRTLGYLPKNEEYDLSELVGQPVGVVGKTVWNPNWRVNMVDIKQIDMLSPTTAIVTPDIQ